MHGLVNNRISKAKKTFFRTYILLRQEKILPKRLSQPLTMILLLLKHLNYLSLITFSGTFIPFYFDSLYLPSLLAYTRLDVIFLKVFGHDYSSFIFMSILLTNILFKAITFLQVLLRKRIFLVFFLIFIELTNEFLMHALRIPILRFCINNGIDSQKSTDPVEYSSDYSSSGSVNSVVYFVIFLMMLTVLSFETIFNNFPNYSKQDFNYSSSLMQMKELGVGVLLNLLSVLFERRILFVFSMIMSLISAYSYYLSLPFYNDYLNIFYIQNWLALALLSFLLILSEIYQNFYVIEIVFPFLYFSLLFLSREAVKRRIRKITSKTSAKDPFTYELIIRYSLFSGKNLEENKENFRTCTKKFFDFSLFYVWESFVTLKYGKDKKMALMKLAKVNMCKFKGNLSDADFLKTFKYFFNIEVEFYAFCLFEKIIADYPDASIDILLINFFYYLNSFKTDEASLLQDISQFILIFSDPESQTKRVQDLISTIGDRIKSHQEKYFKSTKKFGIKKEFQVMFQSFCSEVVRQEVNLNIHKSEEVLKIDIKKLSKKISTVEDGGAILIVSGNASNIGTVLYANKKACELLSYSSDLGIVGTCFTRLIPPPFDAIHKNVLMKFIMFGESSELSRSHFCILDKNRFCVEVAMHLKLSFYKGNAFFITRFKKMIPSKNLILTQKNWKICGFSKKVQNFFEVFSENLLVIMPKLSEYLERFGENKSFLYEGRFLLKMHSLRIDSYVLNIVYIDEAKALDFDYYEKINMESTFLLNEKKFEDEEKSKDFTEKNVKDDLENNDSSFKLANKVKGWERNMKIIEFFRVFFKVFVFLDFLILLTVLFIVVQFSQSSEASSTVLSIGLMRFLSMSSLSSIQSLTLLHYNYTVFYSEDHYRENLKNNSEKLESLLKKYEKITLPFSKSSKPYFGQKIFDVFFENNEEIYTKKRTLFDCIKLLIKYSETLSERPLKSFEGEELSFIYKNIPFGYLKSLNNTVFEVMSDTLEAEANMFETLLLCELVLVILPVSLIFFSLFCLASLERSNSFLWSKMEKVDFRSLQVQYNKITKRLQDLHSIENPLKTFEKFSKQKRKEMIIWIPLFKVSLLFVISLGIYFNSLYGPQNKLKEIIFQDLNHINYGGMRRMMSPLSLFWARNAYLEKFQINLYEESFKFNNFGSSADVLYELLDDFRSFQDDLMKKFYKEPLNEYNFEDYHNFMYGSSCVYVKNATECSNSIIGKGVHLGLIAFIQDIKGVVEGNEKFDLKRLAAIEKNSYDIGNSFVSAMDIFFNATQKIVDDCLFTSKIMAMLFGTFIWVYYAFIGKNISAQIRKILENMAFVAGMFY